MLILAQGNSLGTKSRVVIGQVIMKGYGLGSV